MMESTVDDDDGGVTWNGSYSLDSVTDNYSNLTVDDGLQSSYISPYVQALMYVMYISISVAAIGGNGIVCYIVVAYQKMRTVTNFFIVNLAIGDILMATLCIPFTFVSNLVLMYWPFGAIMCPIVTYAQAVTVFISAYTMVAISIDRYIAIIYPLRPRMTKLQAKVTILVVWMVALGTPLPTAIKSRLHRPDNWNNDNHFICTEVWESNEQNYCYSMILTVLQYVFPLCALIFTYARIAFVVWGKRAPGEAEDSRDQRLAASKRKMIKMMVTCVMAFTVCWMPLNVLLIVGGEYPSIYDYQNIAYVWFAFHWLAMSHTCCNPIIYCWMNSKYRHSFKTVFTSIFFIVFCLENPKNTDMLMVVSHTTLHSTTTYNSNPLPCTSRTSSRFWSSKNLLCPLHDQFKTNTTTNITNKTTVTITISDVTDVGNVKNANSTIPMQL